jgi:Ser/Thr protein kinase RdoA (MazF antagonist)
MDGQEIADAFGLGRASSLSDPVARGELGEVRRLVTERGTWAVKQAFDGGTEAADEDSTTYHRACWQAGLPTPEPIRSASGSFVTAVAGEQLRLYAWVDLEDPDTGLDPAEVGELLARLHAVRWPASGPVHEWFEAPIGEREWKGVLRASRAAGAPYAERLAKLVPGLLEVESILTPMPPVQTCHLDLWADNLRRTPDGGLCVIDFDNCGPADPSRELAMVLFEFGRDEPERWRILDAAYRDAGGPGRVTHRQSLALTVAELHHIGHRHLTMWLAARDDEGRARSLAGVEEFLGSPLLLPDLDRLVDVVRR